MTDDDNTPPIALAPDDGPGAFLQETLTPRERVLAKELGLHDGAPVPFWMFAKVAVRQHDQGRWIGQSDGFWRRIRRHARAGLATLGVNLVLLGGVVYHRIAANAVAEERDVQRDRSFLEYRDTQRRELDRLEQDIRDLRRDLRRIGGGPPSDGISIVQLGPPWPH